ncbi:MAG: ATP-binding cassette domain-containing protein [Deltaproteobacteria bacterium]|nr:ATP-binding cassette domain-containing protein [Deltaproteobacteria bacterium]MCW5807281.1 ATP-binding cassette domain-containing protein [Deltaproteobacteria bacterium]
MTAPLLACRDLVCGYGRPVLEGVTFDVGPGEIVALLGGSGCGKSTLLRTITGLLPPLAGEVRVLGAPIYDLDAEARGQVLRRTGTAFQQDALFGSMTVADNIALPLRELTDLPEPVIREMVRMKLALVGLTGFERRAPASLSGGQRKRAALARATILDPDLVFCDEPSAGLDPVVAASIDAALLQLRAVLGMGLVIVTHELESIRAIADRAVMFGRGTLCAAGTIDELIASRDRDVYTFFHPRSA